MRARSISVGLAVVAGSTLADPLTLVQARARAEQAAPEVVLAEQRAQVAQAEVDAATPWLNPTLTVTTARLTTKLGTTVSLPLQLFGQRGTLRTATEHDARAAELDTEASRRDARWVASLAWLDLWEAQSRAALLDAGATDAARVAQVATDKFAAGSSPRVDVLRTNADRARIAADAAQAHQLVRAAAARLAFTLSLEAPVETIEASGEPSFSRSTPELDPSHPVLRREHERVTAAESHLSAERRAVWPIVSPLVTVNAFDPTQAGVDVIVGLSLDVPLLSQRGGAIARAHAQHALAQRAADVERARLVAAVTDAGSRASAALARLTALREEVLPLLDEARQLTDEGYQAGYFDLVRLLDARRTALETRLAMVEAHATWARAMADLERAAGVSLLPPESP
jgi:outer membrane protein, heavy metal efflux system